MDEKVYGIFSGQYSDWNIHGYFTNKNKAEKYCAKMNIKNEWDDIYYATEIKNIQESVSMDYDSIKLSYEHEVVFDFDKGMRNEPDRYNYYAVKLKENSIIYRYNTWVAFTINTNSTDRNIVEKIAQDLYAQFNYYKQELGSNEKAIKELVKSSGYKLSS